MAAKAKTKSKAPRNVPRKGLSRAQRAKIRDWRGLLGRQVWNLNESPLVHELRRKYEIQQPWEPDEMMRFSEGIERTVMVALRVRQELGTFVNRGGRLRKDASPMAKQYLDRLKGALEGIWLGVAYLRKLMPDSIAEFIDEHLSPPPAEGPFADLGAQHYTDVEPGLAEMLFFGFCPVGAETTRDMPAPARDAVLEDQVEQLLARERVSRELGLMGMEKETQKARKKLQRQLKRRTSGATQSKEIHESGGCYTNGMKALRAAITQMFYTLQARDTRRVDLNPDDSRWWHMSLSENGEPPEEIVTHLQEWADEEGHVLHVYDQDGNIVYMATPKWYVGEDPESLVLRSALKQSRGARVDWSYDYQEATPADASELHKTLTPTQRRRVAGMLERHRDPQTGESKVFTLEEIAAMAEVPFRSKEQAAFQRSAARQFKRNPDDKDRYTHIAQDSGLLSALWKMDLG